MKPRRFRWTVVLALLCLAPLTVPAPAGAREKPSSKKKHARKRAKRKPRGFKIGPKSKTHYVVDAGSSRNQITFTSRAPRETIKGVTKEASGHLDLNPRKLARAAGEFRVAWNTIDTGNPMRNQHMQSPPWVDARAHPEIVLSLSGIEGVRRKGKSGKVVKVRLVGTFAMNGVEKPIKIPATLVYLKPDKAKKKSKVKEGIGIRASFDVALADFNIRGRRVGQAVAARQIVRVSLFLARQEAEENSEEEAVEASK